MAERVVRQLIDDLDGTEITEGRGETVEFSLRDVKYRIDLSAQNVSKLEKALGPYVKAAVKVSEPRRRSRNGRNSNNGSGRRTTAPLSDVRAWANENGYTVSGRGRIPTQVLEAYASANAG
jgi:hypothetical protein